MKKAGALILFLILFLPFLTAQSLEEGFEEKLEDLEETKDLLTDKEKVNSYLFQEWTKILEKTELGKKLIRINENIKNLNPIFKFILGIEYSLSWAFFFAVLFWIILLILIFFGIRLMFPSTMMDIIASIVVTSLIGASGAIKQTVDIFASFIPNRWVALAIFVIALLVAILLVKYSKEYAKNVQKEQEEDLIHARGKVIRKYFDEMTRS